MKSVSASTAVKKKSMIGRVANVTGADTSVLIQKEAKKRAADVPARHVVCGCPTSMRKHRMINASVSTVGKKKNTAGQAEAWGQVFHSMYAVEIAVSSAHTVGKQKAVMMPAGYAVLRSLMTGRRQTNICTFVPVAEKIV